jgi:hypothetical protein
MNSAKRMAQLWQERVEGKQHLFFDPIDSEWKDDDPNDNFYRNIEYKLKPEIKTLEEAATEYRKAAAIGHYYSVERIFKAGGRWAWANPESKK